MGLDWLQYAPNCSCDTPHRLSLSRCPIFSVFATVEVFETSIETLVVFFMRRASLNGHANLHGRLYGQMSWRKVLLDHSYGLIESDSWSYDGSAKRHPSCDQSKISHFIETQLVWHNRRGIDLALSDIVRRAHSTPLP